MVNGRDKEKFLEIASDVTLEEVMMFAMVQLSGSLGSVENDPKKKEQLMVTVFKLASLGMAWYLSNIKDIENYSGPKGPEPSEN